jgi:hypothetical protein
MRTGQIIKSKHAGNYTIIPNDIPTKPKPLTE